jgi:fluoride exporter
MNEMPALLMLIALGGAAGSYARYRVATAVYDRTGTDFPWGTLGVNVLGSFGLGVALPLLAGDDGASAAVAFLTVGVLGAFTTFSSFAWEAGELLRRRRVPVAVVYSILSVGAGLGALVLGWLIGAVLAG